MDKLIYLNISIDGTPMPFSGVIRLSCIVAILTPLTRVNNDGQLNCLGFPVVSTKGREFMIAINDSVRNVSEHTVENIRRKLIFDLAELLTKQEVIQ